MSQAMWQASSPEPTWDLLAVVPGALAAAALLSLLFIWFRESLRHFTNEPREYFASAFWAFAIVGTGTVLFGVSADTAFTTAVIAAAVIFVWQFFAASL